MSALTPHIRVLRALQESFLTMGAGQSHNHSDLFNELGWTFKVTADALEAQEAALKPPREGQDRPISYDPRGKP